MSANSMLKSSFMMLVNAVLYSNSTITLLPDADAWSCVCCSLPRVYVINNEICVRTVCQQDEYLKGERLCRSAEVHVRYIDTRSCFNRNLCRTLQPSCAGSCPGGPGASRGHLIGNAAAIAVATPKPGQTSPDGARVASVEPPPETSTECRHKNSP